MDLGDYLSEEQKKSLYIPKGIQIGTVIRAFVNTTNPPKIKRFVVVGFKNDKISLASVLINSEVNIKYNFHQELVCQHLLFESENRPYLSKDSYVDCSEIHTLSVSELNDKLDKDPSIAIGVVEKEDLDLIMKTLVNSDFIKGKHKKCLVFLIMNLT